MFSFLKKKESNCCEVEIIEVKEDRVCCEEVKKEDCCNESQNEKVSSCC
ncbi:MULTISPECIES: hypothetical protein [unclassified Sutcliffiella]|jgi:hypothetical protein